MDIIHTFVKLEDQFSGAKESKVITTSKDNFDKMVKGVGTCFSRFDKRDQIRYDWKVIEVRQAQPQDYKN